MHTLRIRGYASTLRPSDGERERALQTLKAHYAEGRLSTEELERRVEEVYRSRTHHELVRHLRHLPVRGARRLVASRVRRLQRAVLRMHVLAYASANGSLVAIWAILGGGAFWPSLLLVPTTLLLAWHAVLSRRLTRALSRRGW